MIENPQSFTHASRMGIDRCLALVCSYGYGLSLGEALGGIDRVQLVGHGAEQWTLTTLLRLPNLTYWGDLDPEGLRIYQRLQQRLPDLRLSALLEPMIEALGEHRGHPLDALTGKGGQREAGDWRRGLDQEWLSDDCLTALAGKALVPEQQAHLLACLGP